MKFFVLISILIITLLLVACSDPFFPSQKDLEPDYQNVDSMEIWDDFQKNIPAAKIKYGYGSYKNDTYINILLNDIDFVDANYSVKKILNNDGTNIITIYFDTYSLPQTSSLPIKIMPGDNLNLICKVFSYKHNTPYKKIKKVFVGYTGKSPIYRSETYKTEFSVSELTFNRCYPDGYQYEIERGF